MLHFICTHVTLIHWNRNKRIQLPNEIYLRNPYPGNCVALCLVFAYFIYFVHRNKMLLKEPVSVVSANSWNVMFIFGCIPLNACVWRVASLSFQKRLFGAIQYDMRMVEKKGEMGKRSLTLTRQNKKRNKNNQRITHTHTHTQTHSQTDDCIIIQI